MRNTHDLTQATPAHRPDSGLTGQEYLQNASAPRVNTDIVMIQALRRQYPELHVISVPAVSTSLLGYASSGHARLTPLPGDSPELEAPLTHRIWLSPARRNDTSVGAIAAQVLFGKFAYKWKHHEFLVYVAEGRDGTASYPIATFNYILGTDAQAIDMLIAECSSWSVQLHNEIWVFDNGYWQKSADLWHGIQRSEWKDVILDDDMKAAIRHDIDDFYDSREQYEKFGVPWKRGLIFHGPPGNGKTISIKATMHELLRRKDPIPTLYVRSINSYAGPEYSVSQIFGMARRQAPCFLVLEDLDSIVTDQVRSYFFNEVDGLNANDGILMVGSTNHLDLLDPGLAKRPSRFDRKYLFPDPNVDQRKQYAKYWQQKLKETPDIEFPDKLCPAVASITNGFSFAYMQEAFVASLLALARGGSSWDDAPQAAQAATAEAPVEPETEAAAEMNKIVASLREKKKVYEQLLAKLEQETEHAAPAMVCAAAELSLDDPLDDPLDDIPLWRELKKQIAILREGIEDEPNRWASRWFPDPKKHPYGAYGVPDHSGGFVKPTPPQPTGSDAVDLLGRTSLTKMSNGLLDGIRDHVVETGEEAWLDH